MQLSSHSYPRLLLVFRDCASAVRMTNVRSDERRGELTIRVEGVWMDQKSPHD